MCTATNSAKIKALKANPQIALTIDTTDHPPQILLIRGAASLETVDGIPDEYLQMQSGLVPADQLDGWLAGFANCTGKWCASPSPRRGRR